MVNWCPLDFAREPPLGFARGPRLVSVVEPRLVSAVEPRLVSAVEPLIVLLALRLSDPSASLGDRIYFAISIASTTLGRTPASAERSRGHTLLFKCPGPRAKPRGTISPQNEKQHQNENEQARPPHPSPLTPNPSHLIPRTSPFALFSLPSSPK
jgi:hypothetical protein